MPWWFAMHLADLHSSNVRIRVIGGTQRPCGLSSSRFFGSPNARRVSDTGLNLLVAFNYGGLGTGPRYAIPGS